MKTSAGTATGGSDNRGRPRARSRASEGRSCTSIGVVLLAGRRVLARSRTPPTTGDQFIARLPERGHERLDLRARRDRLHARLRHPRADQLRPRRRLQLGRDGHLHGRRQLARARRPQSRASSSSARSCSRVVGAAAFCATLNMAVERVAYRRLRNAPRLAPLITAIGMSFVLSNADRGLLRLQLRQHEPAAPARRDLPRRQPGLRLGQADRALHHVPGPGRADASSSSGPAGARRCARRRRTATPRG